jgi:hypothetical protein
MSNLLNRKATKKYILGKCEETRPGWNCNRVSKTALDEIEAFIKVKINQSIHSHPTLGKTFMHFD